MSFFRKYEDDLKDAVSGSQTLLDVGCGSDSPVQSLPKEIRTLGVDAFSPSIEKSRSRHIHHDYRKMDVLQIGDLFQPKSFDCVLASDVIEHLTKEEGFKLLAMAESIAARKVIIFTPNGFLAQGVYEENPWQVHKSGWTVEEMRQRGYRVIGLRGWKPLRKEYAAIRFWPKFLWLFLSNLSQLFVKSRPEHAFQILCIREIR